VSQADELHEAQETIRQQAAEIARLRRMLAEAQFADALREALVTAAATSSIASTTPYSSLLEMIVETAAHVISADAASLFLIDREAAELVFEVALGSKAADVKKFRVPLGHGIAGLVAVSGQAMAVSDASKDPRQAADIAQSVDYIPNSILCVPLMYEDEVIGVLELLNKRGGASFTPEDINTLGLFGNQAAVAIEQARTRGHLVALVGEALVTIGGVPVVQEEDLMRRATGFVAAIEQDESYSRAIELARLVREIALGGEREARLCRRILEGMREYVASRPTIGDDFEVRL
jgi:GAF domain-containing protein